MNKLFIGIILAIVLVSCGEKKENNTTNETEKQEVKDTTASNTTASETTTQTAFTDIEPADFKKMMDSKPGILLDVRTPGEVANGKIAQPTHIDIMQPNFVEKVKKLDTQKPIYVYCAVGGRSGKAMQQMKKLGFKEVYNLKGGITAWKQAGYKVEK